tara:strand:+ start:3057 stop:4235 length:1179 start_codon:yes stop_codon:yes gene_type:complete
MVLNCSNTLYQVIETYLNMGWIELSNVFTHNLTAKEKNVVVGVDDSLLIMIGGIRKYLVKHIFDCCKTKNTKFYAFGSDNITSDYDLTLVGKDSPKVVWKMFLQFLKQYNNILPHAFDTNLYCAGIYSPHKIMDVPQILNISEELCVLTSASSEDIIIQMEFALLKLRESGYNGSLFGGKYDSGVIKLGAILSRVRAQKYKFQHAKYHQVYSTETIAIITEYYLTVFFAKKVNTILYESGESTHLIKHACTSQYFSQESYYTPATVNVVVMNIQGKHNVPVKKEEYIISTLENLSDFRIHLQHEKIPKNSTQVPKALLLKYSKYIFRILYSLGKATRHREVQKLAKRVQNEVLPHRKTGNTEDIDWSLIMFNRSFDLPTYIENVTSFVLNKL